MEKVDEHTRPVGNFWKRYYKQSIMLLVSLQLLCTVAVAAALVLAGFTSGADSAFWLIAGGILIMSCVVNCVFFVLISSPLQKLMAALMHSSNEPTIVAPPNPNDKKLQASGLGPIIQYIYELTSQESAPSQPTAPSTAPQLSEVFNNTSSALVIMNEDGDVTFASKAAPVATTTDGTKRLDLLYYTDTPIEKWMKERREKSVHAEQAWRRIATKPVGDKDRKIYDITVSYQKGSVAPFVVVLSDKTTDYTPEDDDLNFIAFAAHELRGPITVIRGYLDTLNDELQDTVDSEQQELFDRLTVSANRLSSYINNILNSSKYDRRHLKVHLSEMTIGDIYSFIADDMQLRASAQHRLLSVSFPPDLPTVAADATSVGEVLGNLIDNAIKYSNEGGSIEVGAEVRGVNLEIYVQDYGIGMPANVVGNLFHKFYRSHRSRETVAGTGIGLYISKAIVESHGGTMEVKSIEGEGSRFMFTLPLYSAVAEKLRQTSGDNQEFIRNHTGSWIKNHGSFRG